MVNFFSSVLQLALILSDENREYLLEAGLPRALVSLLEAYVESFPSSTSAKPLPLPILDLKVIRTAIGVLLNASVGYGMALRAFSHCSLSNQFPEPVKLRLISLNAGMTLIRLSTAVYPPGAWLKLSTEDKTNEDLEETWTLRSIISSWVWRTLLDLKDIKDESESNRAICPMSAYALCVRSSTDIYSHYRCPSVAHAVFGSLYDPCCQYRDIRFSSKL